MKHFVLFVFLWLFAIINIAQPILCGHRGSYWGVENSREAFINGAEKGYSYLETDVKVSGDGRFVLIHDDETSRLGGNLTVASSTLAQLKSETYTQTRGGITYTGTICTLEEYLQICKDYNVKPLIELKWATGINNNDVSNLSRMVDVVISYGFEQDAIILTSMRPCLEHVRKYYPNFKLQFLCNTNWSTYFDWCVENRIDADIQVSCFDKTTVARFHEADLKVNVWTVNDNGAYSTYGNYGCDFITVDYLDPTNLPKLDEFSRFTPNKTDYPDNNGVVQAEYPIQHVGETSFITPIKELSVKKVLFRNDKFYVLSIVENVPSIHIIDANTSAHLGTMNMTGISGGGATLNDISFTADGVLLGCNLVASGAADTNWKIYAWSSDSAAPQLILSNPLISSSYTEGLSLSVSGTLNKLKVYSLCFSDLNASYAIAGFNISNGAIVSSVINTSTDYSKSNWGEDVVISTSPHHRDNIVINSKTINPIEYTFNWSDNNRTMISFMTTIENFVNKETDMMNFFRYGESIYTFVPDYDKSANRLLLKLINGTKGLKSLTLIGSAVTIKDSYDINNQACAFSKVEQGSIYVYVFIEGQGIIKYKIEGEQNEGNTGPVNFKLEKIWSYTDNEGNAPTHIDGTNAQQGGAYQGVFYINDSNDKLIYMYDKDGLKGTLPGGAGLGTACDDAGNIIVRDDKQTGKEHRLLIHAAGTTDNDATAKKLDVTLNESGQVNFISASGDVMGSGGYVYFFSNGQTVVNLLELRNGKIVSVKTSGTISLTGSTAGYVIPIKNNPLNWLYQVRANGIYEYNGNDKGPLMAGSSSTTAPGRNNTCGGEFFTLSGHNILMYNSGANYLGGFSVKDLTSNTVITSVSPIGTKGYSAGGNYSTSNWLFAEKIDPGSYYIYQYCPANGIAVYRFYDANYVSTDIKQKDKFKSKVNIYPVPASDVLNIQSVKKVNSVSIYSQNGSLMIKEKGDDIKSININKLVSGYYIISINNERISFIKK